MTIKLREDAVKRFADAVLLDSGGEAPQSCSVPSSGESTKGRMSGIGVLRSEVPMPPANSA